MVIVFAGVILVCLLLVVQQQMLVIIRAHRLNLMALYATRNLDFCQAVLLLRDDA
jgi:hypothetical protein